MKLMPDVFHMNIEDVGIEKTLKKYQDVLGYIHFADSNRLAPGLGHLNFTKIISVLKDIKYKGWIGVELMPDSDSTKSAQTAITYLRKLI